LRRTGGPGAIGGGRAILHIAELSLVDFFQGSVASMHAFAALVDGLMSAAGVLIAVGRFVAQANTWQVR